MIIVRVHNIFEDIITKCVYVVKSLAWVRQGYNVLRLSWNLVNNTFSRAAMTLKPMLIILSTCVSVSSLLYWKCAFDITIKFNSYYSMAFNTRKCSVLHARIFVWGGGDQGDRPCPQTGKKCTVVSGLVDAASYKLVLEVFTANLCIGTQFEVGVKSL